MDRLRMIHYFVETVRRGGFSRAGRELGLTPASISRQVSQLEDHLGLRLLNRTTRQLSLTEAGELFFERVSRVVEDIAEADEIVRGLRDGPSGVLRVTAPASFGRLHIAPCLAGFLETYPQIKLDLVFTDRLVHLLDEKIDVAIRITAAPDSSMISRVLARQHSVVCLAPAYAAKHGAPKKFDALVDHNCLTYGPSGASTWRFYDDKREVAQVEVAGNIQARDGDSIYVATLAGVGISLQPIWRVAEDLKAGRLVPLFPGFWASSIGGASAIHAYYVHRRNLAPKIKAFVDYLADAYRSPPYWERGVDIGLPPPSRGRRRAE
ncbi:MAG: LysR family transcriptional regulator [Rhodospirillaceae bacterium]|nr:LysR family transcriptional regulator [Rhodospirillaceae bacterium]